MVTVSQSKTVTCLHDDQMTYTLSPFPPLGWHLLRTRLHQLENAREVPWQADHIRGFSSENTQGGLSQSGVVQLALHAVLYDALEGILRRHGRQRLLN